MSASQASDGAAIQQILRARARALAEVRSETSEELGEEQLFFRLGDSGYALPAQFVREVHLLDSLTPLPLTPPFVVGLVNVRGRLLSLIDLRPLLQLDRTEPQPNAYLLIISAKDTGLALLADAIDEVRPGDRELTPAFSAARNVAWIRGIDHQLNMIIDPLQLATDPQLLVEDTGQ